MTSLPPHLTPTITDRGFSHLPPVPCIWGMSNLNVGQVSVYESSAATSAALWLRAENFGIAGDAKSETTSHLQVADALRLADQLVRAVAGQYQYRGNLLGGGLRAQADQVTASIGEMLELLNAAGEDQT
jgi:hypothetical protein